MRWLPLLLAATVTLTDSPAASTIVLDNVRLIDGSGRPPIDGARVVVEGDRIAAAGPRASVPLPAGASRVDLAGRTLMPGLVDAHFHLDNRPPDVKLALLQLANGVTAFRDPGQWNEYFDGLKAAIASEGLAGPRVHTIGPHIDGPGPTAYPDDSVEARDAEEAGHFAERAIAQGAGAIKIYFRLPLASVKAVIDVCRERGAVSTAHLELLEAAPLFRYGLDGIEHITSLGPSLMPQLEREAYRQSVLRDNAARADGRYRAFAGLDLEGPDARSLWSVLRERRPFIAATLAVFERRADAKDEKATPETIALRAKGFVKMLEATRRAHEAGARIVVGGHSSVPGAGRGEAVWREMELLAEAGLSPLEVIRAATAHGAAFLRRSHDLGTIEPGKLADLIVLTGDPSREISEIRSVERVMVGGSWVDVAKYRQP